MTMEVDSGPLDLSATSRLKYEYCYSDSDDSDAQAQDPNSAKAYKKSLMKRYRESLILYIYLFGQCKLPKIRFRLK